MCHLQINSFENRNICASLHWLRKGIKTLVMRIVLIQNVKKTMKVIDEVKDEMMVSDR